MSLTYEQAYKLFLTNYQKFEKEAKKVEVMRSIFYQFATSGAKSKLFQEFKNKMEELGMSAFLRYADDIQKKQPFLFYEETERVYDMTRRKQKELTITTAYNINDLRHLVMKLKEKKSKIKIGDSKKALTPKQKTNLLNILKDLNTTSMELDNLTKVLQTKFKF